MQLLQAVYDFIYLYPFGVEKFSINLNLEFQLPVAITNDRNAVCSHLSAHMKIKYMPELKTEYKRVRMTLPQRYGNIYIYIFYLNSNVLLFLPYVYKMYARCFVSVGCHLITRLQVYSLIFISWNGSKCF